MSPILTHPFTKTAGEWAVAFAVGTGTAKAWLQTSATKKPDSAQAVQVSPKTLKPSLSGSTDAGLPHPGVNDGRLADRAGSARAG